MKRLFRLIPLLLFIVAFFNIPTAGAQTGKSEMKMPSARIVIYRVATGKHLDFLKWMAEAEAIDKEAGVPASQFYAHSSGDSWDYVQVGPDLTDAQQAKVDEVTRKHGRKVGFAGGLEFRTFVASHTDTIAIGPVTAADLVAAAGK